MVQRRRRPTKRIPRLRGIPRLSGIPRRVGVPMIAGLAVLLVALVTVAVLATGHGSGKNRAAGSGSPSPLSSAMASRSPSPSHSPSRSTRARAIPLYDPALHNCGANPHVCGYPDATNTGVPAGMSLRSVPGQVSSGPGWSYNSQGYVQVTGNGAVFRGYSVHGTVVVTGSNAVIADDSISNSGDGITGDGVNLSGNPSDVTIEHTTISSPSGTRGMNGVFAGIKDLDGNARGTKVLDNNIADASTGVQLYIGLIEGNYIHDETATDPGSHLNGTTSNGSTIPLTIQHNTVFNPNGQTDAISLFEDFGAEANVLITDNLVAGGGYTIYGGQNPGGQQAYNIRITNNRFSTIYFSQSGSFGYVTAFDPTAPGNVWSGNIWDSSGAPLSP
jgi:hypothetical protein